MSKKIQQFIEDNGLLLVLSHADTGLSLWEDVGGNIWTWDQVLDGAKNS